MTGKYFWPEHAEIHLTGGEKKWLPRKSQGILVELGLFNNHVTVGILTPSSMSGNHWMIIVTKC